MNEGKEPKTCEETTQGGPASMAVYVLGLTPLLGHLQSIQRGDKTCCF